MKIVVLVKQVPDMERVKFDCEAGRVDRSSAGAEINPFDLNALEAAVGIQEQLGGKIITLSMGPAAAEDALKDTIARGADESVLLSDRRFSGADVKATAKTIAAAIKRLGGADLIFAGIQTVDGDTGQVGPETAGYLDIPHISNVGFISAYSETDITVVSNVMEGSYVKKSSYPVLITVTKDINQPRLPSMKRKLSARKALIPVWGYEELQDYIREDEIGLQGSATKVKRIEVPPAVTRKGQVWRENADEAIDGLVEVLKKAKVLEV